MERRRGGGMGRRRDGETEGRREGGMERQRDRRTRRFFLGALCLPASPSVRLSVSPSLRLSVCPSLRPLFSQLRFQGLGRWRWVLRGVIEMIMVRLRQKTLRLHLRLKEEIGLCRRLTSLEDYRRLLERFLGFYGPVESALERHFNRRAGGFDFERRRKVPMLVSDLRALGVKDLTALPRCAILPALDSAPQAFGCLYALEISTLGWQFVARHLNRSLGVGPGAGCSFFE